VQITPALSSIEAKIRGMLTNLGRLPTPRGSVQKFRKAFELVDERADGEAGRGTE